MTAIVFLSLRILLCLALYAFLLIMFITLRNDLKQQGKLLSLKKTPSLHLFKVNRDGSRDRLFFEKGEITIGRDPTCECQIDDETVSNFHARLKNHHNQWWLEDLNSTNGTLINEQQVTIPIVVINGDEIKCGKHTIIIDNTGEDLTNSATISTNGGNGELNG